MPTARSIGAAAYEQRLRDTATTQERSGRLAEAATAWEILTVIKPESMEYRDRLRDVRRLVDAAFADRLARAEAAQKKGDVEAATTHYLGAMALEPLNARAADGLRAAERERNRRTLLGKSSRTTLTKRSIAESQATAMAVSIPLDSNELEYASMLGKQGEYDDAIALLEARLAVDKGDTGARLLLADLYAQKAEKRLPRDRPGAVAALEKSVRLDPTNSPAAARLRQLKSGVGAVARPATVTPAASSVRAVAAHAPAASAGTAAGRPARAASGPSRTASGGAAQVASAPANKASDVARAAFDVAGPSARTPARSSAAALATPVATATRAASAVARAASMGASAATASQRAASVAGVHQ